MPVRADYCATSSLLRRIDVYSAIVFVHGGAGSCGCVWIGVDIFSVPCAPLPCSPPPSCSLARQSTVFPPLRFIYRLPNTKTRREHLPNIHRLSLHACVIPLLALFLPTYSSPC